MAWEDIAPILSSVDITREQTETYFENKVPDPVQPERPQITKPKVVQIANIMFDGRHGIEKHGGVAKIAQTVKLYRSDCERVIDEINKLYRLWVNQQEG